MTPPRRRATARRQSAPPGPQIELRPINAEEMEQFTFVAKTALAMHGPNDVDIAADMRPEWTTCVFEDGELATTFAAWPFSMRFNGVRAAVAGVTTVGTLPHKRRRGYLRRAMLRSFEQQRERGQSLAILYASMAAIYQRFGYAVASTHYAYDIDPRDVRFVDLTPPPGRIRLTDQREREQLQRIYRAFTAPRNGALHRGQALWNAGPFRDQDPKDGPRNVAIYEEEGEALGYAVYTNREADFGDAAERGQRLTLRDLAWLTPAAYVALWQHLAAHDLVYRIHVPNAPEDDPAFYLLEEPRRLRRRAFDGLLLRVIDVERALSIRPYGEAASLSFELIDPDCEWNRGVWTLETDGPQASLKRSAGPPQLHLPVHALGALINGYLSATDLARMGRIDVAVEEALPLWDRVFATPYRPHCPDGF